MKSTRRRLIKILAGIAAGTGGVGQAAAASSSASINSHQNQIENHIDKDMNNIKRNAYVTLPSFCTKYLCANLHELMNRRPRPVILMDTHDYQRLWGQIVMGREQCMQMVGMIIDALRRRGLIQTINYRAFYSADKQERKIMECRNALHSLHDHKQQTLAKEAAGGFIDHFQRLEYQKSFRLALDNWNHALNRKSQAQSRVRKLKHGRGAPLNRAERLAMQYTAALEVRRAADKHLGLDVVGVIGQGESAGVSALLQESVFDLDDGVARLRSDGWIEQMRRFDPDGRTYERDILDSITEVAQKATGTQHKDWHLLGSQLAVPHFPQLFMESWSQPAFDKDTSALVDETKEILLRVERRTEDNQPEPSHLRDDAESIAEQHGVSSQNEVDEITRQLDRATDLANSAPELREMADDNYESASIMAAATVLMDPNYRADEDEIYRQAWRIRQQRKAVEVSPRTVERYAYRGGYEEEERAANPDWYQSSDPARV